MSSEESLDFARDCKFITDQEHAELIALCEEVGRMLGSMIREPDGFLLTPDS